jgi:hypothetical protein
MTITIDGSGTITGVTTLGTTITSPTFTTPNINSAQFATVSGTAPLYGCRAWVYFNGSGTVAINGSGNVSSITDNGTGDYTLNFTNAMPDSNYSVIGGNMMNSGGAFSGIGVMHSSYTAAPTLQSTTQVRMQVRNDSSTLVDESLCYVSIFR